MTDELRKAEKAAYEKLIRMMSHEVNNSVGATGSLLHSCLTYQPLLPEEQGRDLRPPCGWSSAAPSSWAA